MRLGSNYRVQVSKRVHVSRIVFTPLHVTCGDLDETGVVSVPLSVTHDHSSPCVTAGTEFSMPTSRSLARNRLSCLRAVTVTHH